MIRKADISDIPAIRAMAEVVFRDTYRDILSADQMEYMMDWMYSSESLHSQMSGGHVFFIEDGEGYVSIRPDGSITDGTLPNGARVFHLEKLYVMPQARGKGLGRCLFETAVAYAGQCCGGSPILIELNVNRYNPSKSFYERMGMSVSRQGDFPIGQGYFMNDYIMTMMVE